MKKYLEYFYLYGESYETVSKLLILWLTILGKYFNFSYTRVLEHVHHTENSEYVLIKFERPRQILDKTMPTGKKRNTAILFRPTVPSLPTMTSKAEAEKYRGPVSSANY